MILLVLAGCGYQFGMRSCPMPEDARRIAVPLVENLSQEPRFENLMTQALRERIQAAPCLSLRLRSEADALLRGRILSVDLHPTAVNEDFLAMEYVMRVAVAIRLERARDGKLLWDAEKVVEEVRFYASPDPLLFKDNREEALVRVSRKVSERILDRLMLGF